jgi:hypothetical protein
MGVEGIEGILSLVLLKATFYSTKFSTTSRQANNFGIPYIVLFKLDMEQRTLI